MKASKHSSGSAPSVVAAEDVYGPQAVAVLVISPIVLLVVCTLRGVRILEMGVFIARHRAAFGHALNRDALIAAVTGIIGAQDAFASRGGGIESGITITLWVSLAVVLAFGITVRANRFGFAAMGSRIVGRSVIAIWKILAAVFRASEPVTSRTVHPSLTPVPGTRIPAITITRGGGNADVFLLVIYKPSGAGVILTR